MWCRCPTRYGSEFQLFDCARKKKLAGSQPADLISGLSAVHKDGKMDPEGRSIWCMFVMRGGGAHIPPLVHLYQPLTLRSAHQAL